MKEKDTKHLISLCSETTVHLFCIISGLCLCMCVFLQNGLRLCIIVSVLIVTLYHEDPFPHFYPGDLF